MIYQNFSKRQLLTLTWWNKPQFMDCDGIICDGSIRSGKTVSMTDGFILWSMSRFNNQNFAICGKTIESLRRNVITLMPQWLEGIFSITERRSENKLIITSGSVTNSYYMFGGKDESSYTLVQGITLAGVLFDEVALMPRSFVEQAMARCSVAGSKFWFNCNPENPGHWFYVEWIKKARERNILYLHFTMDDNLSLSEDIKARYRSQYSGVFYQRYILGLWTVAEGLVYDMFDRKKHVIDALPALSPKSAYVACDFGTQNATVFLLFQKQADADCWIVTQEYYYSGREQKRQKTVGEYVTDLKAWLNGLKPERIIVDPSALPLITELRKNGFTQTPANNDVLSGILDVQTMLQTGRLKIYKDCKHTLEEFGVYAWDPDKDDTVLKVNDHCMDAIRYFVRTKRLVKLRN